MNTDNMHDGQFLCMHAYSFSGQDTFGAVFIGHRKGLIYTYKRIIEIYGGQRAFVCVYESETEIIIKPDH